MKRFLTSHRAKFFLLSLLAICGFSLHAQESKPDPSLKPFEYKAATMAKEYSDLEQKMTAYLEQLKTTDPDKAEKLKVAIDLSRSSGTVDTLRSVAMLLASQDLKKATSAQKDAVVQMEKLLELLMAQNKGVDPRQIERLEKLAKDLDKVLKEEMRQEQNTDKISRAMQERDALAQAQKNLENILQRQQEEKTASEKLSEPSQELKDLVSARAKLEDLIAKQSEIQKATDRAAAETMTPDTTALQKRQEALQRESQEAQEQLKKLSQSLGQNAQSQPQNKKQALAETSQAAQQASEKTAEAAKDMNDAGKQLGQTKPEDASRAETAATQKLQEAKDALDKAIAQMKQPNGDSFAERAKSQDGLAEDTQKLAQEVSDARKANEGDKGQQGKQGDPQKGDSALDKAGQQMDKAAENLSDAEKKAAAEAQQRALEELKRAQQEIAERKTELEKQIAQAKHDKMQAEQSANHDSTDKLSEAMAPQKDQPSAPGQKSVQKASQKMGDAERNLGQQDTPQANEDQKKAVEELKTAQNDLQEAIEKAKEEQRQQALAKIEEMLREMLDRQRKATADTASLDRKISAAKTAGKQPERADQAQAQQISAEEAALGGKTDDVVKMLTDDGSTAVFPNILDEVRNDLKSVENYLAKADPGQVTQLVQASVEKNLEDLIDALKNERGKPKKGGGGGGGQQGGQGGGKPPLVPPMAELKMLKMLEVNLHNRTKILDAARAGQPQLNDTVRAEITAVGQRQEKVAKMAGALREKLQKEQQEQEKQP